jgi:hypothetical protein
VYALRARARIDHVACPEFGSRTVKCPSYCRRYVLLENPKTCH